MKEGSVADMLYIIIHMHVSLYYPRSTLIKLIHDLVHT